MRFRRASRIGWCGICVTRSHLRDPRKSPYSISSVLSSPYLASNWKLAKLGGRRRPMSPCQLRNASIQSSNVAIFFIKTPTPLSYRLCPVSTLDAPRRHEHRLGGPHRRVREPLAPDHAFL